MRHEVQDGAQRGFGAGGAAWDVEDEGCAIDAADGAAERGHRRFAEAFGAHAFGESVDEPVADELGGLGCNVAEGQAGAAGSDDEVRRGCVMAQSVGDLIDLVGEHFGGDLADARGQQNLLYGGAGEVGHLSGSTAVANRKNDGARVRGEDGCAHPVSLPARTMTDRC